MKTKKRISASVYTNCETARVATAIKDGNVARPVILCIDDEELGLEIRKIVLEREGYAVLTARDGASGLSIFNSQEVDAVILDYAMPGLDGGQVAAAMRQRKPTIPILMLSAYVSLPENVMRMVNI